MKTTTVDYYDDKLKNKHVIHKKSFIRFAPDINKKNRKTKTTNSF